MAHLSNAQLANRYHGTLREGLDKTVSGGRLALPAGLTHLSLDLWSGDVGEEGARALAERLPPGLGCLSLNFGHR